MRGGTRRIHSVLGKQRQLPSWVFLALKFSPGVGGSLTASGLIFVHLQWLYLRFSSSPVLVVDLSIQCQGPKATTLLTLLFDVLFLILDEVLVQFLSFPRMYMDYWR